MRLLLLQKRLIWTIIFSVLAIGILIPFNILLVLGVKSPVDQGRANFITIMIVEAILVFGVAFSIVNQYFNLHSDYKRIVFSHKAQHPDIPLQYYKNDDLDINNAVDQTAKELGIINDDNNNDNDNVSVKKQEQESAATADKQQQQQKKDDCV